MTEKEQCDKLLDSILSVAKNLLCKNKEFYPIGMVMNSNEEMEITAFQNEETDHPDSNDVINKLVDIHSSLAKNGKIMVSAIAFDTKCNIKGKSGDAILVSVEHKNKTSQTYFLTYKKGLFNKISFGEMLSLEGKHNIF